MAAFADPIFLILVVLLVAGLVAAWRRRVAVVLVVLAGFTLYVLSIPVVGARLLRSLELMNGATASVPEGGVPQAIVVLAAGYRLIAPELGGPTVDRLTLERVRYGARLHRATGLPVLVAGGHVSETDRTLAGMMAATLADDFGVGVRWLEDSSTTTYENAVNAAAILTDAGVEHVFLVTHAWHMPRAAEAFRHAGLNPTLAPTGYTYVGPGVRYGDFLPNARAMAASAYALHEYIGRQWYRLAYY